MIDLIVFDRVRISRPDDKSRKLGIREGDTGAVCKLSRYYEGHKHDWVEVLLDSPPSDELREMTFYAKELERIHD